MSVETVHRVGEYTFVKWNGDNLDQIQEVFGCGETRTYRDRQVLFMGDPCKGLCDIGCYVCRRGGYPPSLFHATPIEVENAIAGIVVADHEVFAVQYNLDNFEQLATFTLVHCEEKDGQVVIDVRNRFGWLEPKYVYGGDYVVKYIFASGHIEYDTYDEATFCEKFNGKLAFRGRGHE